MKILAKNQDVLSFLIDNNSLISSSLNSILIKNESELLIDLSLKLLYIKRNIILRFKNVTKFSLNFEIDNFFYNVEDYKFFFIDDRFYLSLDPDLTLDSKSDYDNDFILSKEVELFEI